MSIGQSLRSPNTLRIGIIGLVLIVAVVISAQNYDKVPLLGDNREYSAYFGDAAGLRSGATVEVAGVKVGNVEGMELAGDKVLVRFSANGVELGTQTEASIVTSTVLGSKALSIEPRGGEQLGADAIIDLDHTTTPYILTDILGELTTTISGIDTGSLTKSLDVMSQTLDKTAPNLDVALQGVSRLSSSINNRDDLLRNLLSNASGVTDILSKRSTQINQLILDGNTLFGALDNKRQAIDLLLTNLSSVATELRGLIDENQATLAPTLDKVNTLVDMLSRRRQDLADALLPLSQYATSLGESVASGPFFKAYIPNLLPGQFLQPFIDAAFSQQGVNPGVLGSNYFPVPGGNNAPAGTIPPSDRGGARTPVPSSPAPPFPTIPATPSTGGN
ncbi:MCE family protein [Williamsia sp. 1138]|uniref:MCE family protein n=1 Tax=Williamsia sp. 1138 TaxID=1903117 RepID=UPI000A0F5613|nr:MCE family protein [Williamsia sp. 1138]